MKKMTDEMMTEGMETWDFGKAEEYLLNIPQIAGRLAAAYGAEFAGKNCMEDIRWFYRRLGCPAGGAGVIHVAGTNGKGSVCAYLCSIMREAGYRTGLFTSPHLVTIRERFRLDGALVGEKEFSRLFAKVRGVLTGLWEAGELPPSGRWYHPTFFEFLFFMAMVWFGEREAEIVVLETGLGGRLDATNAVERPLVTVLTQIGMDHMEYLGDTLLQIAEEKAGIIKAGVPVVFCDKQREVSEVITKRARRLGNPLFPVSGKDLSGVKLSEKGIDFSFHSRYYDYIRLTLSTTALYQAENAALAVQAAEVAGCLAERKYGRRVTGAHIAEGLRNAVWEGRMERLMPGVYMDGAHNEDGIRALLQSVEADGCRGRRLLLFSAVGDKRYEAMAGMLIRSGLFDCAAVAQLGGKRAVPLHRLREVFGNYPGFHSEFYDNSGDALSALLAERMPNDRIYIAGSLYLAGEIKALGKKAAR